MEGCRSKAWFAGFIIQIRIRKTNHSRIPTGDIDKIPAEWPLSKMPVRTHDPNQSATFSES